MSNPAWVPACQRAGPAAGNHPPLVLLHGIGGNRHAFDAILPALCVDRPVAAWDMPGYGGSRLHDYDFPDLAAALARMLDGLGWARVDLLGHSMGGMVAQQFALAHPERVRRLVLAQTSAVFGKPGVSDDAWRRAFLEARLGPLDAGQTPADFAGELVEALVHEANAEAVEAARATMASLPAESYRQALTTLVTFDLLEALPKIDAPALCLAGEHDRTAPAKAMRSMAERMPRARFECLPGVGHLAYLESPAAFVRAVTEFLDAP